ncbi:MAG TPA: hypothetical protein VIP09_02630 [Dehalococcoidia bacterium]
MATKDTIYVVTESGAANLGDPDNFFHFTKGRTKIRANHPALKQVPQFFEPLDADLEVREWPPKS